MGVADDRGLPTRMGGADTSRLRAFIAEASGAAAVEFALLVWPFIALVFACLQLCLVYFMGQTLQTVTVQAGREYMTGQEAGVSSQSAFKTAVCARLPSVFNCTNLMVDVQVASTASSLNTTPLVPTYSYDPVTKTWKVTNTWKYSASTPMQYAIVRVMYDFPVLGGPFAFANQPDGGFLLVGTTVFQVEPYPTS
jgi:Flp pilus assembly protein TadG